MAVVGADSLQRIPGSRHVIQMGDEGLGGALVSADLVDDAVDRALEQVTRLGVPAEDVGAECASSRSAHGGRPAPLCEQLVWSDPC